MQWYLFAAVFLLAASYTLRRNEHVRIDVVARRELSERTAGLDRHLRLRAVASRRSAALILWLAHSVLLKLSHAGPRNVQATPAA